IVDLRPWGIDEPLVGASLAAGADLVSFSGDKLLGGPQAGILAGRPELVERLRRNPLYRAFRLDKLILEALATTLRHILLERWDEVPALRMIRTSAAELRERAGRVLASLAGVPAELVEGESVIGGGSTPGVAMPAWLIAISPADVTALEQRLRQNDPPVVARIEGGRLLLDLRTVSPREEAELVAAVRAAMPA
ncbi:MAG TPA: hypothetical protein VHA11_08980, partial [Bryobacteraceae bacterium]|nr:hypothetical protein [Bryobacteraceae bacterium]